MTRPLALLLAAAASLAGCDSGGPAVEDDLIVTWVSDGSGPRVRLETERYSTCPPPLAVRSDADDERLRIVVEGLSGPPGACDAEGVSTAEVPIRVRLGSYDVEVVHRGRTDLYRATNGVVFSFEAVRTSVTRPGPR